MSFDIKSYYATAVSSNLGYLRTQLLNGSEKADRWQKQNATVINGIAEGLAYPMLQEDAVQLLIDLMRLVERWGFWADYLSLGEQAVELELSTKRHGYLQIMLGRFYYLNRNFDDAQRHLEVALDIAREHQFKELEAAAEYQITNLYWGKKELLQAREHGLRALALLPETPSRTLAALYNSLGLVEMELLDEETSEKYFWKALSLWDSLKDSVQMARCYLNLGVLFYHQQCLEEAERCYQSSLDALGNVVGEVDRLKALNGLGTLHYAAREYRKAEAVFRQGVVEVKELNIMYHLRGSLTHNLGNTLLALGILEEARLYLDQAIAFWEQADDDLELANSVGTLAEVYEADEAWQTAVATYDQALELLVNYPDHPWAKRLRQNFTEAKEKCARQLAG